MTYDSQRASYDREHIYIVEVDLDYCSSAYAVGDCKAGERQIYTSSVSVDDFNIGDEIEGAASGAIATITNITGSAPSYDFFYTVKNGIDFQAASETINNNTSAGVAVKGTNAPIIQPVTGDDKCYNTFNSCDSLSNYTPNLDVNTGTITIDYNASTGIFTRGTGSFLTDGFSNGDRILVSGFDNANNNGVFIASVVGNAELTVEDTSLTVTETGDGNERITLVPTKVYRFCESRSPHPIGIDAIPSLRSVSLTPAKVDYTGGMGQRSSVTLTFDDHPHNDLDIDQYVSERSYIASDRGLFWTKLRARNPGYQFRDVRVLTGYLENGEFIADNFKTRNYVIEKLDVNNGQCVIVGKDTLKKASDKKAQVPVPSKGIIDPVTHPSGINATETSLTLIPAGIGNAEYDSSGWVTLSGSEIASYNRAGDVLTLTRGQYNTTAKSHDKNTTVQLCYQRTDTIDNILYDILVRYANISGRFIDPIDWLEEVKANPGIDGNLSGLIAKPTDVNAVIKELSQAKPFALYWNELDQKVIFEVLKLPPDDAQVLDEDSNLIADSVNVVDRPELRASTVYVTFGQIDPTKSLTDPNNYTQTIVRVDTDSIAKYESDQIKTIISRWIPSTDKTTAESAAQLYGRRFSEVPREITFSLDAKDNTIDLGNTVAINHSDILAPSGLPVDTQFQITSKQESRLFNYRGLEYTFSDALDGEDDINSRVIKISTNELDVNLYDKYVAKYGSPDSSTVAIFEVEPNIIVGASDIATPAMTTGSSWPSGASVTLRNNGFVVGKGGDGGYSGAQSVSPNGGNGGLGLDVEYDLTIINTGIIGGGGGGSSSDQSGFPSTYYYNGGGGAGSNVGLAFAFGEPGTTTDGGRTAQLINPTGFVGWNGKGGDLGQDGTANGISTGGAAGDAINENGNTVTYDQLGDIRGAIV